MDELNIIQKISVYALPVLFAITLHEAAHGYVAKQFGDRTSEMLGRLTLNPIKHIDPVGTLLIPAITLAVSGFTFGWAKPVPVNMRNLRNPKTDMIWVAAAGPMSNFLQAIAWVFIFKLSGDLAGGAVREIAIAGVAWNVGLMVLNLLPILPLDGGRILAGLLPRDLSNLYSRMEPFGMFIVLGLAVTHMLSPILMPLARAVERFLLALIS